MTTFHVTKLCVLDFLVSIFFKLKLLLRILIMALLFFFFFDTFLLRI